MQRSCLAGLVLIVGILGFLAPANAHRPSDAFLKLDISDTKVDGSWEISLRDLDHAIGLDADLDGAIDWGELKAQHEAIAAYALARFRIGSAGAPCPARTTDQRVIQHNDGAYAVLRFAADCPQTIETLQLNYDLFFDLDPSHRGLIQISADETVQTAIFSPDKRSWDLNVAAPNLWLQTTTYLGEGVWHIWIGFDHILFLLSLLLPAVQRFGKSGWQPKGSLREIFFDVARIVTAFTVAHSITLILATLGWINLPSRLVEPVIAATIILAALNNIFPVVHRRLWMVAFGFGLIHGVGFASALQALGLPPQALLLSLLSFNLGVEFGQLAIVSTLLPIAFWLRRTNFYPRVVLRFGSLAIITIGSVWLIERSLGVSLLT